MPAAGGAGGTVGAGAEAPGWASEAQEGGSSSDSDGHEAGWLDDADGDDVTVEGYRAWRPSSYGGSRRKRRREGAGSGAEAEHAANAAGASGERQRKRQREKRRRADERGRASAGE